MFYNWLEERGWHSILSSFTSYRIKCPIRQPLRHMVGVGRLGVVVVGCTASVLRGEMLICSAFRRRHRRRCSFISCFQWIVNKQRLLSLQRRDGRLVLVPVSAQYWRYRYQTDTTGIGPIPIPSTGIGLSLDTVYHDLTRNNLATQFKNTEGRIIDVILCMIVRTHAILNDILLSITLGLLRHCACNQEIVEFWYSKTISKF